MSDSRTARSRSLFDAAGRVMPGGVNSPVRAYGSVGGDPRFIRSATGSRVTDVDGNDLVDFVGSWGPMLLGHAHPEVLAALHRALDQGTSFGAPTEAEVELAELVVEMVPSVEMVRLVSSGTEATMSAIRLARGATGRDRIVKFRGGYHGHADAFLVEAGSGAATLGTPSSPGVPAGTAADTLVAEYNDLDSVHALFGEHPGEIAAIIIEPIAGNMGCIPPEPGFLEGLRSVCDDADAILIFDEVMTGFRVAPGGAQQRYGVRPDLTTLGKVLGGGLPVGAYGGRRDLMARVAPSGPVYQAGTLSGNPLAVAAGLATLRQLHDKPDAYVRLEALGARLDGHMRRIVDRFGDHVSWSRVGAMAGLAFVPGPVRGWSDVAESDQALFRSFFWSLLDDGFHIAPSCYEAMFWSTAHDEDEIDRFGEAAERALGRSRGS